MARHDMGCEVGINGNNCFIFLKGRQDGKHSRLPNTRTLLLVMTLDRELVYNVIIFFICSASNISRKPDMPHIYCSLQFCWGFMRWRALRNHSTKKLNRFSCSKGLYNWVGSQFFLHSLDACCATFWYFCSGDITTSSGERGPFVTQTMKLALFSFNLPNSMYSIYMLALQPYFFSC